jgi:hypothetical protein
MSRDRETESDEDGRDGEFILRGLCREGRGGERLMSGWKRESGRMGLLMLSVVLYLRAPGGRASREFQTVACCGSIMTSWLARSEPRSLIFLSHQHVSPLPLHLLVP